jgi:hypothetical protein
MSVARVLTYAACAAFGLGLTYSTPWGAQKITWQFKANPAEIHVLSRSLREEHDDADYEDRDEFYKTFP